MKKILILVLIVGLGIFACNQIASEAKAEIAVPTVKCGMCVNTIKTALADVKGVDSTEVDLEKKIAFVVYNTKMTNVQSIEKAIAKAGYKANNTERDPDAYASLPMCCKETAEH